MVHKPLISLAQLRITLVVFLALCATACQTHDKRDDACDDCHATTGHLSSSKIKTPPYGVPINPIYRNVVVIQSQTRGTDKFVRKQQRQLSHVTIEHDEGPRVYNLTDEQISNLNGQRCGYCEVTLVGMSFEPCEVVKVNALIYMETQGGYKARPSDMTVELCVVSEDSPITCLSYPTIQPIDEMAQERRRLVKRYERRARQLQGPAQ